MYLAGPTSVGQGSMDPAMAPDELEPCDRNYYLLSVIHPYC